MEIKDPLTHKIIGCAMNVYNFLGNGFQEVIYQRALAVEFKQSNLDFVREKEMPIYYKAHEIGTRRVDFLVEGTVMVELKALSAIENIHLAQGLNYLTVYRLDIGLILNFGGKKLQVKRLYRKNFV
ncbi:MAG: GxxExxY protein [Desulfamplus sp.]|nr:GxxExxY protein [Desulfamplus sp.]